MTQPEIPSLVLAGRIAGLFVDLPQVKAVALGGSLAGGQSDPTSDIDLYVYTRAAIPLEARQHIVDESGGASVASLDLPYWGPGDEWYNAPTGIEVRGGPCTVNGSSAGLLCNPSRKGAARNLKVSPSRPSCVRGCAINAAGGSAGGFSALRRNDPRRKGAAGNLKVSPSITVKLRP